MTRKRQKRRKPMAEINVVPYIDVMLVLLVIFMITAPLLAQDVKVNLPKAQAEALAAQNQPPIIVTVDAKGNYYLNISKDPNQPIAADKLVTQVTAILQMNKNTGLKREVLLRGDRNVNYGKVVQAMALLQQAGALTVGLMTQSATLLPKDAHQ
jgi:biopolymer transport protein TolR